MNQAKDIFYLNPENELSHAATELVNVRSYDTKSEITHTPPPSCEKNLPTSALNSSLSKLTELIANTTEAYTAAVYLREPKTKTLTVGGVHTLSRDFNFSTRIGFGCGLIGWVAQSSTRLIVSPFEHDAKTLMCYTADQSLKSFIAVPILDKNRSIRGVVACDSKKNYAFAKITEKILFDFAEQALILLELHEKLSATKGDIKPQECNMSALLENFRSAETEDELLTLAANISSNIVDRDALIVLVTAQDGVGRGVFYSAAEPQSQIEHRLLELVCRHKRIICAERSVHALSSTGSSQCSFLSVPFKVLGVEAGSLNLLSRPHDAFHASQISTLESVATALGNKLEHIRLKDRFSSSLETNGILSWKSFSIRANVNLKEAKQTKINLSLVRLSLNNLTDIEKLAGSHVAVGIMQKVMRLIEQVKRDSSLACYLYGFQILILMESAHAKRTIKRLRKLIEQVSMSDFGQFKNSQSKLKLGELLIGNSAIAIAEFPRDGDSLSALVAKTLQDLEIHG